MYLALEGIDTAGKSTQIGLLQKLFKEALITKEPGGTAFGEQIREIVLHQEGLDPLTELLLFLSDRREHYVKTVQPALQNGQHVISDRSLISGIAYAKAAKKLEYKKVVELNLMTLDGHLPDAVILFDIPKETLTKRLGEKSHDGIEKRGIDYLLEVQRSLIDTTKELGINHLIVDASDSIESIHLTITQYIKQLKEEL